MPTVAVTGSSGKLGRHVVAHLAEHGYRVIALDRAPDPTSRAAAFVRVDLTDYGQVIEALTGVDDVHDGVDAVVHLAAIPAPGLTTNAATFANNITATYNVFAAARRAGIRSVVWASSETVLGLPFETPPPYIPVDEEYPPRPNSTYSLVKTLEEEMARQFCRWEPDADDGRAAVLQRHGPAGLRAVPRLRRRPAAAQLEPVGLHRRPRRRAGRPARRWSTAREAAGGVEVFVIANADTVMSRPSADLAAEVFPGRPGHPGARRARDAAVDREGAPGARLCTRAQLARRAAGGIARKNLLRSDGDPQTGVR